MAEKRTLGVRDWKISDLSASVTSRMKPLSDGGAPGRTENSLGGWSSASEQMAFLRMNVFADRNSMVSEVAEFNNWVHQRNFSSAAKSNSNQMQVNEMNAEMGPNDIHRVLADTRKSSDLDVKLSESNKKQPSGKSSGKRVASKVFRPKQPKKTPSPKTKKKQSSSLINVKREKKNLDIVFDLSGTTLDLSHVPTPVCSCTGVRRQCYRWGAGGWQSSCCTTNVSEYPLPMSPTRPGARLAGRKMSNGAYLKLLQRLAADGHDLSNAVDLKNHWARHGTNKFVTIK